MTRDRAMTIHFMDGTKVSFDFPAQEANASGSALLIDEILKHQHLLVEAEGGLLIYPVTNIKSIQLTNLSGGGGAVAPKNLIRGARVVS